MVLTMGKLPKDFLIEALVKLTKLAVTTLPPDVKEAIENAYRRETNPIAKKTLEAIIENYTLAEKTGRPICQDTGTLTWFVNVGTEFPHIDELGGIIREAAIVATEAIPIRPNAVDPWTGVNSENNTGRHIPWIRWHVREGDDAILTVLPKGGGSEYTSQLRMVSPGLGIKGIKEAIIRTIFEAGGMPCPPVIVGVGVGGGADISLELAKLALLRPINVRSEDALVAKLEEELLNELNSLKIGPMGLGGDTTVLGVNIEWAHRHPATLPVGIVTQCWAARRATLRVTSDLKVQIISHNVKLDDIVL